LVKRQLINNKKESEKVFDNFKWGFDSFYVLDRYKIKHIWYMSRSY